MDKFLKGLGLIFRYGPVKIADWQEQSIYDPLTGLYNRRHLLDVAERELALSRRSEKDSVSRPTSLIFLDLKKFKEINDGEGHVAGDESLRRVAALLKKVCRREVDVIARVGGDEFVVLLPQTRKSGALVVVEKIQETAAKELFSPGGKVIGIDCGLIEFDRDSPLEELMGRVDEAMYQAKKGLKP